MVQDTDFNVAPGAVSVGRSGGVLVTGEAPLRAEPGLTDLHFKKQRSLWGNAWRQFRRHRLAMAGVTILVVFFIGTYAGSVIYAEPINAPFAYDTGATPSLQNPMGVDSLGQDIFARILYGGRISLAVGLVAATVAITLGTLVGALAGFFGGFLDSLLMRITDMFISLPQLPLLLLITFLFKDTVVRFFDRHFGTGNFGVFFIIVAVIGALTWMPTARLVRASFLSVKEKEFVEAARSIGATRPSLIFRHILPNVISPIIVAATLAVGAAIITESALSFLGLGFPSDVPTWGAMLFNAKDYIELYPHEALFPGTMIFLTVLAINYVGDGLRDALDPRKTQ
ncbi:MAG: ABC transporter permease [Chloroflexota bacterium]|nr:ABC transporter permease [Chloroflexota bacterium]